MTTPFDVFFSLFLGASAILGFCTWMLIRQDESSTVPWWHGLAYIVMTPFVVILHIACAPVTAVAHIYRSWHVHLNNLRNNSTNRIFQELMPE